MLPRFAIIIAAFNGMDWIRAQVESIISQRDVSITIFVSVDSSNDGTESWFEDFCRTHVNVVLLPNGRYFGGAALNFYRLLSEVDLSEFDYLGFADQDDVWYQDKLWRAHLCLADNDANGYSCNVRAVWPNGRTYFVDKAQPQRRWDYLFEAAGPGCTYVLRKDLAISFQKFVLSRWSLVQSVALHDWLVYAYARASGYKWVIDKQVFMDYRQHSSNQVGVNAGWRAFKYRVSKVLEGWGTQQASVIASVLNLDQSPFVRRWKSGGRLGLLWLALNANQCRRRKRDQVLFALSCLALAAMGRTHKP